MKFQSSFRICQFLRIFELRFIFSSISLQNKVLKLQVEIRDTFKIIGGGKIKLRAYLRGVQVPFQVVSSQQGLF
jgi:hypothetical protein